METREMTLNNADIVRVLSTNALDEPDLIKIDHVRDIRKHECRRRLLCFNCKKPGYLWCKCDNTLKVKKGHGKARPVKHVQEDKWSDERYRMTKCNVDNVKYKDVSALIGKIAHINEKTLKILADVGSSVNLIWSEIATRTLGMRHVHLQLFDGSKQNEELRSYKPTLLWKDGTSKTRCSQNGQKRENRTTWFWANHGTKNASTS